MKKIAAIATGLLSLGYLGAFEMPVLSLDTSTKFETEHVVRGRLEGRKVFSPRVNVSTPVFTKGKAYLGAYSAIGADGDKGFETVQTTRNSVDPYIGLSYEVTDMFTLDAGYINHIYPNLSRQVPRLFKKGSKTPGINGGEALATDESHAVPFAHKRNTSEIYFGVLADVLLAPSAYFFYDLGSREAAIEGNVSYTYDLAQFGVNGVSVELGAKLGYDKASRPFACKTYDRATMGKKGYFYYGVNADLVYGFNEHTKARAGIEIAGNSAKKAAWVNRWAKELAAGKEAGSHKSLVWFNASVDCSF
jgi:opacity protein-like surface antigen